MKLGNDAPDLFSPRMLFRGWPAPAVVCPVCERPELGLVSVELCRGNRRTIIDGSGVRHTACSPGDGWGRAAGGDGRPPAFEMRLTFHCGAHASTLRLEANDGGIAALVDAARARPSGAALCPRAPASLSRQPNAGSARPPAKLVLVTPGRGQPCARSATGASAAVSWRSRFFTACSRWAATVVRAGRLAGGSRAPIS